MMQQSYTHLHRQQRFSAVFRAAVASDMSSSERVACC